MLKFQATKTPLRTLSELLVTAALLCGALSAAADSAPGKKEARAEAAATSVPTGVINATVQWLRRAELSTPLAGTVTEVTAETGDAVRKDQVVLRLDARTFQALAAKTNAQLRRLETARNEARRELRVAETLQRRELMSEHEVQQARIVAAGAEADYRAAQAAAAQAQIDLEHCTLRAPFDGVVVQRSVEPGQHVQPGSKPATLLVIAETGRMRARAEVTHEVLAQLKRGQTIKVKVAGKDYNGTVKSIGLEPVDGLGGQFAQYELVVEFAVPPDAGLYAGEPAQLSLQ